MKKICLVLAAILVVLLAACGQTAENAETTVSGTSESEMSTAYELKVAPEDRNQAFCWSNFVETSEAYYYGWNHLIYFCPRGADTFYPLCGKPNCLHSDENCNAWFDGFCLGYYDAALYATAESSEVMSSKLPIIRIELDGTNHEEVAQMDVSEVMGLGYTCTFHHGKLFIQSQSIVGFGATDKDDHLIVLDLSDYSVTEPAADYLCTAKLPLMTSFYKDKLYGYGSGSRELMNRSNECLIEVDAVTGEARKLASGYMGLPYATDHSLYYFITNRTERSDEPIEGIVPGFRELDLESGEVRFIGMPVEDIVSALYDEDYIYAFSYDDINRRDSDSSLFILSWDYELVDQFELKNGQSVFAVTSDRIFLSDTRPDTRISWYLDKSQIGSHNLTPLPIETVSGGRTPG